MTDFLEDPSQCIHHMRNIQSLSDPSSFRFGAVSSRRAAPVDPDPDELLIEFEREDDDTASHSSADVTTPASAHAGAQEPSFGCLQFKRLVSKQDTALYFEITLDSCHHAEPTLSVGLCPGQYNESIAGVGGTSLGWQASTGMLLNNEGTRNAGDDAVPLFLPPFAQGDTVGLGWDLVKGDILFTKNGELVEHAPVKREKPKAPLYPTITLECNRGFEFTVNLGLHPDRPFAFTPARLNLYETELAALLRSQEETDMELRPTDGAPLPCHSALLLARLPAYRDVAQRDATLAHLNTHTRSCLGSFLYYLYTDELGATEARDLPHLVRLGIGLELERLAVKAVVRLSKTLPSLELWHAEDAISYLLETRDKMLPFLRATLIDYLEVSNHQMLEQMTEAFLGPELYQHVQECAGNKAPWPCPSCTFINISSDVCEMCSHKRPEARDLLRLINDIRATSDQLSPPDTLIYYDAAQSAGADAATGPAREAADEAEAIKRSKMLGSLVIHEAYHPPRTLRAHMKQLYQQMTQPDFAIQLGGSTSASGSASTGTETSDPRASSPVQLQCHRSILAARSAFFGGMLRSGMRESSDSVLQDTSGLGEKALRGFLYFAYTDELPTELSVFEAIDIQEAALFYQTSCDKMIALVHTLITSHLDSPECLPLLLEAHSRGLHDWLRESIATVVEQNYHRHIQPEKILEMPQEVRDLFLYELLCKEQERFAKQVAEQQDKATTSTWTRKVYSY